MPRGKRIRKNKHNESTLITQLMRISLRVDDHIYNHRPLPGAEAARYLQEIATLKLQCLPSNARALQVIEKLTRLMRSILTEEDTGHASSFNNSFPINTEFAGSASPVYSLPDEDRPEDIYELNNMDLNTTCISDEDETIQKQNNISRGQNNIAPELVTSSPVYALTDENRGKSIHGQDLDNLNTTRIPHDVISHREMYISRGQVNLNTYNKQGYIITTPSDNSVTSKAFDNGEVIDITDTDLDESNEIAAVCNKQSVSIEHVNSGISNMVIQDELGKQKKPIDVVDDNCSQSLLDNYANDNENANGRDKAIENKSYKEDVKARVINKVNNYFQKQTPLADYSQETFSHETSANSQATKVDLNKDNKSVSQGVLLENNKMGTKKKAGNEKNKTKKRKTKKTLKSKENNTAYPNDILNATTAAKYDTNKNRPVTVKKLRKPKKVHQIYNENVENDLSWVENVRYVREISPSEYDPALSMLPDNFWNNFDLPGAWNDADFEV